MGLFFFPPLPSNKQSSSQTANDRWRNVECRPRTWTTVELCVFNRFRSNQNCFFFFQPNECARVQSFAAQQVALPQLPRNSLHLLNIEKSYVLFFNPDPREEKKPAKSSLLSEENLLNFEAAQRGKASFSSFCGDGWWWRDTSSLLTGRKQSH